MFELHKQLTGNSRSGMTTKVNSHLRAKEEASLSGSKIFSLEGIGVSFGSNFALKNIDFNLHRGEIVFLTGVSGAGKTTLLRVLAGHIEPDEGRANFYMKNKIFTAPVFQDLRLIDHLNCAQNLELIYDPMLYRNQEEFQRDMMDLCKFLGIAKKLNLKIKDANGGLKQKVSFIRALLSRPDVILADEPTAALDFDNARRIFEVLNLYNVKQGLSVIWATHNKELAKKFTGRMVHLDRGKIIYSGHACFI